MMVATNWLNQICHYGMDSLLLHHRRLGKGRLPDPDISKRRLIILDLKSGIETPVGAAGELFYPVWSPDGEKSLFSVRSPPTMAMISK